MDKVVIPKVTVLMPVYNAQAFLNKAMESILCQTFTNFEFLIINDGSTDNSENIIQSYSDPRISYYRNEKNEGIIGTLNKGISLAKGKYIARMDADDISLPERLMRQTSFLDDNPVYALVATQISLIDSEGHSAGEWKDDLITGSDQIKRKMPFTNCIAHPSVMIKTEIINHYKYNTKQRNNEDYDLWLRLLSDGYRIAKLSERLLLYRQTDFSITAKANKALAFDNKMLSVKYNYLKYRLFNLRINKFDLIVFFFLIQHLKIVFKRKFSSYIRDFPKIPSLLFFHYRIRKIAPSTSLFCFFPSYHTGGAEQVHADIMSVISQRIHRKEVVIFFTNYSQEQTFKNQFWKIAQCFEVVSFNRSIYRNSLIKSILKIIEKSENPILFGSNSPIFYEIIPQIKKKTKNIDLTHAFSYDQKNGVEKISLSCINVIHKRIVINPVLITEYENLFNTVGLNWSQWKDRYQVIPNKISYTWWDLSEKNYNSESLNVIFVGRNSYEKRIELIGKIASQMCDKSVKFTLVGAGLDKSVNPEFHKYLTFAGEITDKPTLASYYKKSHVVLITSSREGFPLALMEGMAHGAVALTTDVGGISYHVHHQQNGFLVPSQDDTIVVEQCIKYLNILLENPLLKIELGRQAQREVYKSFSPEVFNQAWDAVLLE
ncbi:D-inositol-3-phosphate glycosyltransferase [Dyadobacter sp. CECT 9275]|uniref:D-inositol-3-phosphate glycosyltransferase n=1 Tax=Dyadobacter helix TaxID=2822344 RepID=A0A916N7C1_9BACT|nr:glycosyltransferase [Dyadobacter sp. CECT 9275]CAG5007983.1 D-inositol-3-phosphate glycosyltransferase [Dyadobacter sp. CECT 9275]